MAKRQDKKRRKGASRRTVRRSISLSTAQWRRLDSLGEITKWGRNGVVAQALDLLVDLSVPLAQRVVALKRTSVGSTVRDRVRAAIESAVAEVEVSSPTDPWAAFDAALALAGPDIDRSGVLALAEPELLDLADRATRGSRRKRRGDKSRA